MPRNFKEWMMLVVSLVLAHGAGVVGAFFTVMSVSTWYAFIEKPDFAPPDAVFLPVWLVLYTLMAFAFYLIWRESTWRTDVRWGMRFYLIQLGLNALWSILFFGLQNPFYAFIDIVFLIALIGVTMLYFSRVSKIAFWLMVPYLIWVIYAGVLNYVIFILN